jgi:dienelactone hydrolase
MKIHTLSITLFSLICLLSPGKVISQDNNAASQQNPSMIIEEGGTGPYKAVAVGEETLPGFTVYRPQNLAAFGKEQKLPVVLWGNGGCVNTSNGFKLFLNEIASNGFIVIAIGPYSTMTEGMPDFKTMPPRGTVKLLDGLDWAIAENSKQAGAYYGKLDLSKVAVAGQSCGGLQAMEASPDPRVTTTLMFNSGVLNSAAPAGMTLPAVTKDTLKQLHGPVAYFIGGESDVAYPNAKDDLSRIDNVPAVMLNQDVGHGGTYTKPHGGTVTAPAVAWLKWQLRGDSDAALMFKGENCGVCQDPAWKIQTKNLK